MELALDSFKVPGDGFSTASVGMQTAENAARWRLVWCYHSCFKSDCEHLRASLMSEVKARGGVVQMMKQVKHLEQWLLKPMVYSFVKGIDLGQDLRRIRDSYILASSEATLEAWARQDLRRIRDSYILASSEATLEAWARGVVQMMKQVKHLEQWLLKPMDDKTCAEYVILTSWRHLKPLWNSLLNIQIEELELKRSLPAAIYVYAEETVSYERASAWVFENNLQDVIFVLPNLTPQLAGSFVEEFLTKIEAGRANLPITSSAVEPWQDYQTVYSSMDTWEPYSMYSTPSPYVESHEVLMAEYQDQRFDYDSMAAYL
ncbi:hypothetical protein AK812_SmicGene21656 [Symbiodinium microadriaticum]|uniref:Uncharacterized protein n=1 Tax=Symbiodinium microadriaticum TaxID=2951 RepID=A0A1Q9DLV5_SYMMI|nr:hypothetical protein AK812_SmicGene21656 [Symbiodinium microadriaticum]